MADEFDGLGLHLGNLPRLSRAKSRSISAENPTGEKGGGGRATEGFGARAAEGLGRGWKVSPAIEVAAGETREIADIEGPGAIQQIWCTVSDAHIRHLILRIYWDGQEAPSVECPLGDFFACGWNRYAQVSSLAVCVNPGRGFNCYWEMPFRERARITFENRGTAPVALFYQVNYALTQVPEDAAYFHAQFRRSNPLPYMEDHTLVDGVTGRGHYVGCYLAWGVNHDGWWGEGEFKFFIDGDAEFPTVCGTGVEDYFGGAYCFLDRDRAPGEPAAYVEFSTPYSGMPQVLRPDGAFRSQLRFGLYRWHIADPVRFESDLRVTVQSIGWRESRPGRYLPRQDDIASVAFWYQTLPTARFPELPDRDRLEVN